MEGRKTVMAAEMRHGDTVTASCEVLFIRPKGGLGLQEIDSHAAADAER